MANLLTFATRTTDGITTVGSLPVVVSASALGARARLGLGVTPIGNINSSEETLYDMGEATNRSEVFNEETGHYVVKSGKSYGLLAGVANVGKKCSRNDARTYNYG